MKLSKKRIFILLIILLFFFKGILYRTFITYSIVNIRSNIQLTDTILRNNITHKIDGKTLTIQEIISLTNTITSNTLSFTFKKTSRNSNLVFKNKKANCIGYASLFNSIGNYILEEQQITDTYTFTHLVGKLEFLGFDIHQFIDNPFFKDHDFNQIKNLKTGKHIYVDPSLNDYFYINEVRLSAK